MKNPPNFPILSEIFHFILLLWLRFVILNLILLNLDIKFGFAYWSYCCFYLMDYVACVILNRIKQKDKHSDKEKHIKHSKFLKKLML